MALLKLKNCSPNLNPAHLAQGRATSQKAVTRFTENSRATSGPGGDEEPCEPSLLRGTSLLFAVHFGAKLKRLINAPVTRRASLQTHPFSVPLKPAGIPQPAHGLVPAEGEQTPEIAWYQAQCKVTHCTVQTWPHHTTCNQLCSLFLFLDTIQRVLASISLLSELISASQPVLRCREALICLTGWHGTSLGTCWLRESQIPFLNGKF